MLDKITGRKDVLDSSVTDPTNMANYGSGVDQAKSSGFCDPRDIRQEELS